jgi:hypothetical protein
MIKKSKRKLIGWCVFANGIECMTPVGYHGQDKQSWQSQGKRRKPKVN